MEVSLMQEASCFVDDLHANLLNVMFEISDLMLVVNSRLRRYTDLQKAACFCYNMKERDFVELQVWFKRLSLLVFLTYKTIDKICNSSMSFDLPILADQFELLRKHLITVVMTKLVQASFIVEMQPPTTCMENRR